MNVINDDIIIFQIKLAIPDAEKLLLDNFAELINESKEPHFTLPTATRNTILRLALHQLNEMHGH
jgi:hypothetical protein